MTEKTGMEKVNRNTAVLATAVLANPCAALDAADVPIGATLWGFDPTNPIFESLVFKTAGKATREPNQHFVEPFMMRTWAAKKVESEDEKTGAMRQYVRLMLIDVDGELLTFGSSGVCDSMDMIRTLRGDGPYDPPIPVLVQETTTRSKRRMYQLVIDQRKPAGAKTK